MIEAGQPTGDGQQGVLGGVRGIGRVAGHATAHGVEPVVVGSQQLLQGLPVTGLGPADQLRVAPVGAILCGLLRLRRDRSDSIDLTAADACRRMAENCSSPFWTLAGRWLVPYSDP